MDTRYEGDRRLARDRAAALAPKATTDAGFNFKPMASNTDGYHPKGVGYLAKPASAPESSITLDKPRKGTSAPLDGSAVRGGTHFGLRSLTRGSLVLCDRWLFGGRRCRQVQSTWSL